MQIQPSNESPIWGDENPRRGVGNEHVAALFIRDFPIGSRLTAVEFDAWGHKRGVLPAPKEMSSQSDGWKAHLHRRHELKTRINRASTTTKLATPFVIETIPRSGGMWEVRSPEKAVALSQVTVRVESLIKTKRRQLAYLMQSADWTKLPPWERDLAESIYEDIEGYAALTNLNGEHLTRKFVQLRLKLEAHVKSGDIIPTDDAIRAITDESGDDPDDSDDGDID